VPGPDSCTAASRRRIVTVVGYAASDAGCQLLGAVVQLDKAMTLAKLRGACIVMTPQQLRAARALAGWSRKVLAQKACVHHQTIVGIELLERNCEPSTIQKIRRALEVAGAVFIDDGSASLDGGASVRLAHTRRNR
jgi:DNA-binding XRE family transcriptional regulator